MTCLLCHFSFEFQPSCCNHLVQASIGSTHTNLHGNICNTFTHTSHVSACITLCQPAFVWAESLRLQLLATKLVEEGDVSNTRTLTTVQWSNPNVESIGGKHIQPLTSACRNRHSRDLPILPQFWTWWHRGLQVPALLRPFQLEDPKHWKRRMCPKLPREYRLQQGVSRHRWPFTLHSSEHPVPWLFQSTFWKVNPKALKSLKKPPHHGSENGTSQNLYTYGSSVVCTWCHDSVSHQVQAPHRMLA